MNPLLLGEKTRPKRPTMRMTSLVTFTSAPGGKRSALSAALTYGTVARLQLLRARQQEQIASETPGERAARLQRLRARQQERIASETPGEREQLIYNS